MLTFKIIKDIKECEKLWKSFSLNKTLWEQWDVNLCFYDAELFDVHFIVGYEADKVVGFLPLWYNKNENYYGFFGGEFPEKRIFFVNDKTKIKEFLKQIPNETYLLYIDSSESEHIEGFNPEECDNRFFIDITRLNNDIENLFKSFSKKHRKNLRYDIRQLEKLDYKVEFDRKEDFDKLVEFNVQRFGKESDLHNNFFAEHMKRLMNYCFQNNMLHMISIIIDEKVEGIEVAALYNDVYYVLNAGVNLKINNLGKLLIIEHIKNAIKLKAKIIDFMSGDSGWKKLWNCEEEVLYEVKKIEQNK